MKFNHRHTCALTLPGGPSHCFVPGSRSLSISLTQCIIASLHGAFSSPPQPASTQLEQVYRNLLPASIWGTAEPWTFHYQRIRRHMLHAAVQQAQASAGAATTPPHLRLLRLSFNKMIRKAADLLLILDMWIFSLSKMSRSGTQNVLKPWTLSSSRS